MTANVMFMHTFIYHALDCLCHDNPRTEHDDTEDCPISGIGKISNTKKLCRVTQNVVKSKHTTVIGFHF